MEHLQGRAKRVPVRSVFRKLCVADARAAAREARQARRVVVGGRVVVVGAVVVGGRGAGVGRRAVGRVAARALRRAALLLLLVLFLGAQLVGSAKDWLRLTRVVN